MRLPIGGAVEGVRALRGLRPGAGIVDPSTYAFQAPADGRKTASSSQGRWPLGHMCFLEGQGRRRRKGASFSLRSSAKRTRGMRYASTP